MKNRFKSIFSTNKDQRMNILGVLIMAAFVFFVGLSVYNIFIDLEENSTSGGQFTFEIIQPSSYNERLIIKLFGQEFSIMPIGALTAKAQTVGENIIQYVDAFPNTDIVQTKANEKLKEDIILKQPGHPKEFAYQIDLTFYDFEKDKEGNFIFYVKGKKGEQLYRVFDIPAPFLIDADNKKSSVEEVETNLSKEGLLTLRPSEKWLVGAKYPVILDPTIEVVVLNIHSHPQQGENWEVEFSTKGTADLKIIPNDQATIDDDEFVSLFCDGEKKDPQILAGDIIFYPNWFCAGNGKVIHYTKKAGNHVLRFEFGDQIAYAYNSTHPDGGTISHYGNYTVHTFISDGTITFNKAGNVDVLVVGGGGGGGGNAAGGGGAGGYRYVSSFPVSAQEYNITVGDGGSGGPGSSGSASNGEASIFSTITAAGGGAGGGPSGSGATPGNNGGSGGGGQCFSGVGGSGNTPATVPSQGNNGGTGAVASNLGGGGGGGSGSIGANGVGNQGGNGGDGTSNSISGTPTYYAAGGGAGGYDGGGGGDGGSGIGGHGGWRDTAGTAGTDGTGSGGGGGGAGFQAGGKGGSGIVIIRYLNNDFDDTSLSRRIIFRTNPSVLTGGNVTYDGDYTIHTFTSDGTITFPKSGNVEVLVVAGGGGGGHAELGGNGDGGGGGGAGGLIYNASYAVTTGVKTVTVGNGGNGATLISNKGSNGENSIFDSLIAIGGGGGGSDNDDPTGVNKGADGGSGGGAANSYSQSTAASQGTSGQGNNGGDALTNTTTYRAGSGGGGANSVGQTRTSSVGGNGGDGLAYSISGSSVYYAGGGGGGGKSSNGGIGGIGGGGDGGLVGQSGSDGIANTGGGGGGGSTSSGVSNSNGGNGGSGIVIIKYLTSDFNISSQVIFKTKTSDSLAGGDITIDGDYTIHTFTSDGSITFPKAGNVEVLVVGGGGGGAAGGGGGGGYVYESEHAVSPQTYNITVGDGGLGVAGNNSAGGANGTNSVFDNITAYGGGGGGGNGNNGKDGASGGGGSTHGGADTFGGSAVYGSQGNNGSGNGGFHQSPYPSGAGGGAGAVGQTPPDKDHAPDGGAGLNNSISGVEVGYGGGGGGVLWTAGTKTNGLGTHGGGDGYGNSNGSGNGEDGTPNTGGGGGGCAGATPGYGGDGGSGIVIIRYLTSDFINSGAPVIFRTGVSW